MRQPPRFPDLAPSGQRKRRRSDTIDNKNQFIKGVEQDRNSATGSVKSCCSSERTQINSTE